MSGRCQHSGDVDLAAFLAAPGDPEWAAFRDHYPRCQACTTELAAWMQLEAALRSMKTPSPESHPAVEDLARFQRGAATLSADERTLIEHHLAACRACAEEVSMAASFDFSQLDAIEPAAAPRPARRPVRLALRWEGFVEHVLAPLRQLVLHPAFAYALVVLLCVPALRYYLSPQPAETTRSLPGLRPERSGGPRPETSSTIPMGGVAPSVAAAVLAVLDEYKAGYEARDLDALGRVWQLNPDDARDLQRLFEDTRRLSLLVDVREVRATGAGDEVTVEFLQGMIRTTPEERLYAVSAEYTADIRRRGTTNQWVIESLQKLPD